MSELKSVLVLLLCGVALSKVRATPVESQLGSDYVSMKDINAEAYQQMIRKPVFGSNLTIFSYLGNGFLNVKGGSNGVRLLSIRNRQSIADNLLVRPWSYYDSLVTFITRRGIKANPKARDPLGQTERLVRQGDEIVAKMADDRSAAHFMLKRYPPMCGDMEVVKKPQFVQMMLVERDGGSYHRSLLHAVHNRKGQIEMKLLKTSSEVGDECKNPESPSVLPGTLFMLNYN